MGTVARLYVSYTVYCSVNIIYNFNFVSRQSDGLTGSKYQI